ncbi:MAG: peptide deformylase [Phycisphaerae bacterium]|nr:peptide deformylase [Phycisphaerae bacterium]
MPVDPASLRIVHYPAAVLRLRAEPVPAVTDEVRAVALRMIDLMREAEGVGLAAPQVGLSWRLFVAEVPEDPEEGRSAAADPPSATRGPVVYVNPVLSDPAGAVEPFEEGCLSLPDIRGDVLRPPTITIGATGMDGRPFSHRATGLLARCWQHEMDHLDGILILDRMTQMARLKNRPAVRRLEKA